MFREPSGFPSVTRTDDNSGNSSDGMTSLLCLGYRRRLPTPSRGRPGVETGLYGVCNVQVTVWVPR